MGAASQAATVRLNEFAEPRNCGLNAIEAGLFDAAAPAIKAS
jgi:hypothetical protein